MNLVQQKSCCMERKLCECYYELQMHGAEVYPKSCLLLFRVSNLEIQSCILVLGFSTYSQGASSTIVDTMQSKKQTRKYSMQDVHWGHLLGNEQISLSTVQGVFMSLIISDFQTLTNHYQKQFQRIIENTLISVDSTIKKGRSGKEGRPFVQSVNSSTGISIASKPSRNIITKMGICNSVVDKLRNLRHLQKQVLIFHLKNERNGTHFANPKSAIFNREFSLFSTRRMFCMKNEKIQNPINQINLTTVYFLNS